jgi:hypothetical protein
MNKIVAIACALGVTGCASAIAPKAPAIISLDERTYQMSAFYTAEEVAKGQTDEIFTSAIGWYSQTSKVCPLPYYSNTLRRWTTPQANGGVIMNAVMSCDLTRRY